MSYNYTNFGVYSPLIKKENYDKKIEAGRVQTMESYMNAQKSGRTMLFEFTHTDDSGNFTTIVDGIKIIMPYEEVTGSAFNLRERSRRLLYRYETVILSLNPSENEVYVSHAKVQNRQHDKVVRTINYLLGMMKEENKEIKDYVTDIIENETVGINGMNEKTLSNLKKRMIHERISTEREQRGLQRIIVPALVEAVQQGNVIVDIMGYKIPGYIPKHFWTHGSLHELTGVVGIGDIVDVEVLSYRKNALSSNGMAMYMCARTTLVKNPWDSIEESFKVNDIIRVKCTSINDRNWFGMLNGLEDIQVFCEFPDVDRNIRIILGEEYQCYIYRISSRRRLLKARVFRHINKRSRQGEDQ